MSDNKPQIQLVMYAIRNEKGEWHRSYSTYKRAGWVKDLDNAKLYTRRGVANAQVTRLANIHPHSPVPELVEFTLFGTRVFDQNERVAKSREKKKLDDGKRDLLSAEWARKEAEAALQIAKERVEKLTRK